MNRTCRPQEQRAAPAGIGRKKLLTLYTLDDIFRTLFLFFRIPTVVRGSVLMRLSHLQDPLRCVSVLKRICRNSPDISHGLILFTELTDRAVDVPSFLGHEEGQRCRRLSGPFTEPEGE